MKHFLTTLLLSAAVLISPFRCMAEITVSAAASLSDAFTALAKEFRTASGITVHLNFASSNTLLRQIRGGAPADVFASADQATMDEAEGKQPSAGEVCSKNNPLPVLIQPESRKNFAATELVLITPENSSPAAAPEELADPLFRRIAVGSPQSVPAGRYAQEALEHAKLWKALEPKLIYGGSVRQVLAYVQYGEADAGIVYRTDALSAQSNEKKRAVRLDAVLKGHTPVVYPIAVTSASAKPEKALRFIEYVLSSAGQAILAEYGFTPAP